MIELLDSAKQHVPTEYWSRTPITLKATAGLRLLPKAEGDAILEVVRKVSKKEFLTFYVFNSLQNTQCLGCVQNCYYTFFQVLETSGFLPEDNLIEIMNPMEEGLYAWFTVNFLLGKFDKIEQVRYSLCPYRNCINMLNFI